MLSRPTTTPDGTRVRLRLPNPTDRAGLAALHARLGVHVDDLELTRMLRFDPRHATVACATAWIGGTEMLVGYGAIEAGADEPHLLVCDEEVVAGVGDALAEALRRQAGRSVA